MMNFIRVGSLRRAVPTLCIPPLNPNLQLRCLSTPPPLQPASSPVPPPPASKPKTKPNKSPAALRRTASASLPIRTNPTPTRGQIQPVFTMSTAERYQLGRLRPFLPKGAVLFEDAWCIPKWGPKKGSARKEGEIWVFGNGSFVCWGLEEIEAKEFATEVIGKANMELGRMAEAETEELEFVTDPTEQTRLQGDLIILGDAPPLSDPSSSAAFLLAPNPNATFVRSPAGDREVSLSNVDSFEIREKLDFIIDGAGEPPFE